MPHRRSIVPQLEPLAQLTPLDVLERRAVRGSHLLALVNAVRRYRCPDLALAGLQVKEAVGRAVESLDDDADGGGVRAGDGRCVKGSGVKQV